MNWQQNTSRSFILLKKAIYLKGGEVSPQQPDVVAWIFLAHNLMVRFVVLRFVLVVVHASETIDRQTESSINYCIFIIKSA